MYIPSSSPLWVRCLWVATKSGSNYTAFAFLACRSSCRNRIKISIKQIQTLKKWKNGMVLCHVTEAHCNMDDKALKCRNFSFLPSSDFHHHPPLGWPPLPLLNSSIVRQKLLLLFPSGPKLALLLVLVHPRLLALGNSFRISATLVPRPRSASLYCIVSLHCFRIFFSHQHILLVKLSSSFINLLEHPQYLIP